MSEEEILKNPKIQELLNGFKDKYNPGSILASKASEISNLIGNPQLIWEDGKIIVYPNNTKFFHCHGRQAILIIEDKPTVRTVKFSHHSPGNDLNKSSYRLAFPYIIYLIRFIEGPAGWLYNALSVSYRNSPLESISDEVFHPNLPNISEGVHAVCMPYPDGDKSLSKAASLVINEFWASEFGDDLMDGWYNNCELDGRIETLSAWEKASRNDPFFPLTVKWANTNTLKRILIAFTDYQGTFSGLESFIRLSVCKTFSNTEMKEDLTRLIQEVIKTAKN